MITKEILISQIRMQRPHVVILGAGASRAACPKGDKNGKILPLMSDFVETLELNNLLESNGINWENKNFEEIYADICITEAHLPLRQEIEKRVYSYFTTLELPDNPTLYDHLILSLRNKDIIASFNWDPLLLQAYRRNGDIAELLPQLVFLHGNVSVGICNRDKVCGINGMACSKCGQQLAPSRLLYPITKNYREDIFISDEWNKLQKYMKNAFMFTVFGYSAPKSDIDAISLLREAWGPSSKRTLEEVELINTIEKSELIKSWYEFIHKQHYSVYNDFYSSWLGRYPRRTGEAFIANILEAEFVEQNPFPVNVDFDELWLHIEPLCNVEICNTKG